jgi:hypothetical protein
VVDSVGEAQRGLKSLTDNLPAIESTARSSGSLKVTPPV